MSTIGALRDRFVLGLLAMVVVGVGVVMLCWPVHLDAYDRWGFQISCGSGLATDDSQAAAADGEAGAHRDDVDRCHAAVRHRRVGATVLLILGGAGATANAGIARRRRTRASSDTH